MDIIEKVKDMCSILYNYSFKYISHKYSPQHFGNLEMYFKSEKLCIQVLLDRGLFSIGIAPTFNQKSFFSLYYLINISSIKSNNSPIAVITYENYKLDDLEQLKVQLELFIEYKSDIEQLFKEYSYEVIKHEVRKMVFDSLGLKHP